MAEPGFQPAIKPDSEIWANYMDEATKQDDENIDIWSKSMDVLLVFVRLFSFHACVPWYSARYRLAFFQPF